MYDKDAVMVLTDRCNASCEVCYAGCSPSGGHVMDESLMLDVLGQIKKFQKKGGRVFFTGGEPFLYPELLKKGLVRARELGFKTEVCSNGFFGRQPFDDLTAEFESLPLDYITISTDYYHEEHIPEEEVLNAMRIVKRLNLPCTLRIGETVPKSADRFLVRMGPYKFMTNLNIHPFMRIGRAESLPEKDFFRLLKTEDAKCPSGGYVTVRYDGEVFPCGGPVWADDAFSIGSVSVQPLEKILKKPYARKFSVISFEKDALAKTVRAARDKGSVNFPDQCGGACEICRSLFRDRQTGEPILERITSGV